MKFINPASTLSAENSNLKLSYTVRSFNVHMMHYNEMDNNFMKIKKLTAESTGPSS